MIRVFDDADNVIEAHEYAGDFKDFVFDTPSGVCVTTRCNEEVAFHTFHDVSPFTAGSWWVGNLSEQRNEADRSLALPAMVRG